MPRRFGLAILLVAALSLSSCEQLGLPEQGFVTRHVGSLADLIPDSSKPPNNFDGRTTGGYDRSSPGHRGANEDKCEWAAQHRAEDADAQGFDEDTQRQVYELTLKDCRAWTARL